MFAGDRRWFERHPLFVAYDLLGAMLTVRRDGILTSGRVVEVEAYADAHDLASHAGKYRAGKVALRGEPGRLYMYRSYGIHTMTNIVAHEAGTAGAVLIRALEPIAGTESMRSRRGERARLLATGPGSLSQAMGFRLDDNGDDVMLASWLTLEVLPRQLRALSGPRIGIAKGLSVNWRLFCAENAHVSSRKSGVPVAYDDLKFLIPPIGTILV